MSNKNSEIKKEIFLPSIIGDWTTYTAEKNKASISITKSIGNSNKTISESTIEKLLFFHQEFFESFFEELIQSIDSHIVIDTISINILNHAIFKENQKSDIYVCKFHHNELDQIDFILSKKAAKFIAHRLCGGTSLPENNEPTDLEISLISVINQLFFKELSNKWKRIFEVSEQNLKSTFGNYYIHPQQHENETLVEITTNFKLFNHHDLSCKLLYSLETIEKLLDFYDQLNDSIIERTFLTKETLNNTLVDIKSTIGTTSLTIKEIQNLELGDVVLIDNKKLQDPIRFSVDDNITFNAMPVCINENEIAVQLINTPIFERYIKELNLPKTGPLIHSENITEPQPLTKNPISESQHDSNDDLETEDNIEYNDSTDLEPMAEQPSIEDPSGALPEEPDTAPNLEPVAEAETLSTATETTDTDDFSWDDLDE